MSRWLLSLIGILLISTASARGGDIPYTSAGLAALKGKDICDLKGTFYVGVGVYLDQQKQYALRYLVRNGVDAVFLLSKPTTTCGLVDAVMDLTPIIKTGESLEFKCYTDNEGGTTWGKWGQIIGLANNDQGSKRIVKARLSWRVNIKERRFEEIKDKEVECDTAGYTD